MLFSPHTTPFVLVLAKGEAVIGFVLSVQATVAQCHPELPGKIPVHL
jgi:hypothetical protein